MHMRIISLVPSITELLVDLGLENQLIAVTKYCVHPKDIRSKKENIGGTKTLNIDLIKSLKADLIIANKEENQKEQIEQLMESEPIWLTDIRSIEDNWEFILETGQRCNKITESKTLVNNAKEEWKTIKGIFNNKTCLYFIWRKPYMTIGHNTFINNVLLNLGFKSIAQKLEGNYPEITPEWITEQSIDYILLSSEPYAFKEKHKSEFLTFNPTANIQLIDGEMCSWYGSRMLKAPSYFKEFAKTL